MVACRRSVALIILSLFLSSVVLAAPEAVPLGETLLGQSCVAVSRYAEPIDPQGPQLFDIRCGAANIPSGSMQVTPFPAERGPPTRLQEIVLAAIKESSFTIASSMRLACFPGKFLTLDGNELLIASCSLRNGGWPFLTVAGWRAGQLVQAEGPAAIFPLVRDFIAGERHALTAEEKAALLLQLESVVGGKVSLNDGGDTEKFRSLCESARLQDTLGNYEEAEDDYRKALEIQKASLGSDVAALGDTMMHLALEVSNQGRGDEARELFKAADPLIQKSVDPIDDARLVSYLALDAANRHSFAEARDLARRATESRRALANGGTNAAITVKQRNSRAMINSYLARGEMVQSRLLEAAMSLRLEQLGDAAEAAEEALEISQSTPGLPSWWPAEAMSLRGEIEGKLGHPQLGESLLRNSLEIYRRLFGDARPTALAWLSFGRFHVDQGQYEQALQDFRQGLSIFTRLHRNESILGFDQVATYFTTAIELADHNREQHDQLLAELFVVLQLVQKAKESDIASRSFARLAETDAKVAEILRDLQDSERTRDEMRLSLASEEAKPANQRDHAREVWLAQQFQAAAAMAAHLDQGLKQNVPEYRRLSHPGLTTVTELQAALRPGELFVTFAFGEEFGLVFAVSATSVEARPLAVSASAIADQVRELREGVIVRSGRVGRYDLRLAYDIYRGLLQPIENSLHEARHLVISASGPLASLPLGALVTRVPTSDNLRDAAWLIRRFDISQMPQAAAYLALRRLVAPSHATRAFLGIGNPRFRGGEGGLTAALAHCGVGQAISPDILAQLPPLPDTASEVRNVAAALGAGEQDLLLGDAATESNFRARPLDQYRILYFATHGLLPAELRCQSEPALALTPPPLPPQSRAEDGLLEASEIAGLKLDADLVVLSACNTATAGGKFGGDTLASLSDMFFYAGSRAVLATHWPVPSSSTALLMSRLFTFYENAPADGYSVALQRAQLALLADPVTAHPVHWAGFSLMGGATQEQPMARIEGAEAR